jgi:predicted ATPase
MLLHAIKLTNLLSFGPDAGVVELRPLNVLVGPNGSGKSNFIEAIALLHQAPRELVVPVREGGGVGEWIWKGSADGTATLDAILSYRPSQGLRHRISFTEVGQRLEVADERIESEKAAPGKRTPSLYFGYEKGRPRLSESDGIQRPLRRESIHPQRSILSRIKDPERYPELTFIADAYEEIAVYREWSFGRGSPPRRPQPADLPTDHLLEDASNLGLILNRYRIDAPTKKALIDALRLIFDGAVDFSIRIEGGTVQVFLEEASGWSIPATRLSDGTIRWLALLAVLLDPKPPRLVCIEEPELGLHPDLVPLLARLLKEASARMQLVVTTHSEVLVDALSGSPDDVLVCERDGGATTLRRLDPEKLREWLRDYSLGQLWSKGELGGNRW